MQMLMPLQRLPAGRREIVWGFCIFFALANAVFFPFVWGNRTLQNSAVFTSITKRGSAPFPHNVRWIREYDPTAGALQTEPWFALQHRELARDHQLPLWNPYSGYGVPLAADMQSEPYSPFAWIGMLWVSARGYDVFVAVRIFAAGFFAFLFLRTFAGFVPALAGGAAYMFTGYLWLFLSLPQLSVEVMTPLLLLGVERLVRDATPGRAATLAAILGVSVLGGMPESSALAVILAAAYAAMRIASDASLRPRVARLCTFLVLSFLAGSALSAIAVLPFFEFQGVSWNMHQSGSAASILDPPPDAFSLRAIAQYVAPLIFGPPRQSFLPLSFDTPIFRGCFGASAAFFAGLALFSTIDDVLRRRPRERACVVFFASVVAVFLSRRFGFAATAWMIKLPVLRLILLPKYEEALVAIAMAALVAAGVERLTRRRFRTISALAALLVPLAILTTVAMDQDGFVELKGAAVTYFPAVAIALGSLLATAALAAVALRRPSFPDALLGFGAFGIVGAELIFAFVVPLYYGANKGTLQSGSALLGAPYVDYLTAHLSNGERFYGQDQLLTPNWNAAFAIDDVRDLDAVYPERYFPFARAFLGDTDRNELLYYFVGRYPIDRAKPLERRFLRLSSVRYYAAPAEASPSPASGALVFSSPIANVYELDDPLPRVAFYRHAALVPGGAAALQMLRSPSFAPEREAVVEGDASALRELADAPAERAVAGQFETRTPTDVRMSVNAPADGIVVFNDTNFPGWTASVDGRPAHIFAANFLFRGVLLARGRHVVEFRYTPVSFVVAASLSLAALCAIVATWSLSYVRGRRSIAQS